jgi:hypothetical protein
VRGTQRRALREFWPVDQIEQALISFFEQIARKDEAHLESLRHESSFSVDEMRWSFTVPDLFAFLQRRDALFADIDYRQFRKLIFASPVNQTAKAHGAEVIIADNRDKVDKSTYALVWGAGEKPGT